ncbi:glycosyltransferase [Quadrisphaera sp. KR29]|uniref:glycosyltransferase n=1 Tax=Quadrisphaera sp. KR29 TaxID=3461391 RepID=UPI00404414D3
MERGATTGGQPVAAGAGEHPGPATPGRARSHGPAPDRGPDALVAHVDAVVLACDGERWLPRALEALDAQTRAPDRVVLLDAASGDRSAALLAAHARRSAALGGAPVLGVLALRRRAGLLDAARAALAATDASALLTRGASGAGPAGSEAPGGSAVDREAPRQHTSVPLPLRWVWLLHDDCAPAPDALEQLLAAVEVAPSVGIAGCKVVDWHDEGLLHQVGFSTSAMGRRLTGVEHGDRDQGQRDHRDDVLAVSSAGMLVRRDLLERLGGDPALPVLGEDLDLCRRARLAGSRVVVVPSAVVRHVDATRSGARATPAARSVRWTERRHEAHARLVAAAPAALPLVALAVLLGGLARLLVRVAAKQPSSAGGELTAVLAALARPDRVSSARRAAARTAVRPRSSLRPLLVPRREVVRWHRDRWARTGIAPATGVLPVVAARALAAATTPPSGVPVVRLPEVPLPRRSTDDAPHPRGAPGPGATGEGGAPEPPRRGLGLLLPLLAGLLAVGLLALHPLLAGLAPGRQVTGGALAAAPALGDLWAAARSGWQPLGLGTAAPADPWLSALALLSLPVGGSPRVAVVVLLLLALPLAGLGGWAAAGAATRSRVLRAAAALTWAGAAPLLAAAATGRVGALVAHLALPFVVLGLARCATAAARRPAVAAGALAGLAGALAVAGAPLLLVPLLVLAVVVALSARRWAGAVVWAVLAPLAVTGPLLAPALTDPRALLLGPGLPVPATAAPAVQLLLADPGAALGSTAGSLLGALTGASADPGGAAGPTAALLPGALTVLPGAVLLVLALAGAAARGPRARVARAGWWAAGAGLLAATAAVAAGGWAGPATSLVLAGLLTAAAARAPRVLRAPADDLDGLDDLDDPPGSELQDGDPDGELDGAAAGRPEDLAGRAEDPAGRDEDPARGARSAAARRGVRWAALAAALATAGPVLLLGAWALQQSGQPGLAVSGTADQVPAVALDAASSPDAVSTLHLRVADDGAVTVLLRRGPLTLASTSVVAGLAASGSPVAGASATASAAAADAALRAAAAQLAAGSADPRRALAELGVGYVLLETSAPQDQRATARLDSVAGLTRAGSTAAGVLYRVLPASGGGDTAADRPSRARLVAADGTVLAALASDGQDVDARLPAVDPTAAGAATQRTAVVAERSGPGWTARLDGERLPVVTVDGWALGVEVPAGGGHLVITRAAPAAAVWDWVQGAVVLLTAMVAVPVPVRGRSRS